MKTLSTVIAALVLSLCFVSSAHAQQTSGPLPEVRVALPAELAACVNACMAPAASPRPADHTVCPATMDSATSTRIETLSREISRIRSRVAANTASIADHEARIRTLEGQIGLLRDRVTELERQVREQRDAIAALRADLATLRSDYERAVGELGRRVTDLETSFTAMTRTVSALETRVSNIESRMVSIRIGVRTGPMVLGSLDGTVYTGWLVAPQLTFQLTPNWRVMAEAGAPFSISSSPVGTYVRGSLGYDFTPNWSMEGGVSSTWTGYNSHLEAKSAFVMGDVGARFSYRWFNVSANFMAGSEFDQHAPAAAFGGMLLFGGEFPR
ncbi:MAG TPA: hypothetical protein VL500_05955 [Candidatus Eisenbacteria bacterium]|jgi:uncharacterized coiled-coil protein SlyX|nr:hypothetical protein [Candidatus Eisenbacteria bacterium]